MNAHPPVPPIHTSGVGPGPGPNLAANASSSGKLPPPPPPPPPKSPFRTTRSSSMTRRRGDGKVITLNIPAPLSALNPGTRPVAEEVRMRSRASTATSARGREKGKEVPAPPMSPTSPGATLAAMRRQTKELRTRSSTRHYAPPASPLRLQSAEREAKRQREATAKREEAKRSGSGSGGETGTRTRTSERPGMGTKRESSLSRIGRRLSLTRRASRSSSSENMRKSLRKGLRKSSSFGAGLSSATQGLARRLSFTKLARRESAKLKSILKPSQAPSQTSADRNISGSGAPGAPATESKPESRTGAGARTEGAFVASRKVGASWHPPRKDLNRRQSASKLYTILKPIPNLGAPAIPNRSKPPISASCSAKSDSKQASSSQQASAASKVVVQQDKTTFDIVASSRTKQTQLQDAQAQEQATTQDRDGRDILAEINQKNLPAAEARRLIRQHNQEYFRSQIWDPELQRDSILYRLANDSDELPVGLPGQTTSTQVEARTQNQARVRSKVATPKRDSAQTLVGSPMPPGKDKDPWRRYKSPATDVSEWGRNVRLAMAQLEDKITTEATSDPANFMKARRESAQLRAWIAAQRRTSEARMSAIAMGRVRPESPFEHAFVAELLRENENRFKFKHSSNPIAEAEKLFQDYNNRKNSLLPHYVPLSQYPLLTPLEEIEAEAKREKPLASDENPKSVRRLSAFDEKKAARRAGREYKSFSTSDQLDQLEMHEARCCGLWKPKAFVAKIS